MKRPMILLALAAILPSSWCILLLTAPNHRITERALGQIRIGMSEADVVDIIGVQAGDYSTPASKNGTQMTLARGQAESNRNLVENDHPLVKAWICDSEMILIGFDRNIEPRVVFKAHRVMDKSTFDSIRQFVLFR